MQKDKDLSKETVEINEAIGRNVKKIRKESDLGQKDLHKRTGIKQGAISLLERGQSNPTISTLIKLKNALGVELMDLLKMS